MPTYDYRCTKCKLRFELFHSITDDSTKRCPRCKGKAVRTPSAGAGLLFKGSGFYITDYRSRSYREKAKQEGSGTGKTEGDKTGGEKKKKSGSGESGGKSGSGESSGKSGSGESSGKSGSGESGGKSD
jgi:putative FmdB family regulatory protein